MPEAFLLFSGWNNFMLKFHIRDAVPADVDAVASLHARSWMIAYRGLLSDEYLDNDLEGERKKYWRSKAPAMTAMEFMLVAALQDDIVGFITVMDIPQRGLSALVDNLHVRSDLKGLGVGGALMKAAARKLMRSGRHSFYLWVLEGNTAAEKFYISKGGVPEDKIASEFGGKVVNATRFVWRDFDELLSIGQA